MKKQLITPFAGLLGLTLLICSAFTNGDPAAPLVPAGPDTIPAPKKIRNLDDAMKEVDASSVELEKQLKSLSTEHKIDAEKIHAEIAQAMKGIEAAKLKHETDASLAKADIQKMHAELAKLHEIDLPKITEELKNLRPQIERSLAEAKVSIEKAKESIKEYKAFEAQLAADGLIDKEKYTLKHEDGIFSINGKVQSQEVYNKYKTFLDQHKKFNWKKDADNFSITND